jgi:hypothetical protein
MSNTTAVAGKAATKKARDYPWWAVPTVLGIIMVSSGIFMVLLAWAIDMLSAVQY